MPTCSLKYDGRCDIDLVVDIHGTNLPIKALIDTGFVSASSFGLKLPANLAIYAKYLGTGEIRVADSRLVAADSIPDAKIVQIEKHKLAEPITIPAIFMGDSCSVIGMVFLQNCILHLDGPKRAAEMTF